MNEIIEMKNILKEWRMEEFLNYLDKYLKDINREEYKYLLINLLELSLLEKDNLEILFDELEEISKEDYEFISNIYLQKFYWYIKNNKGKEAEICFKILTRYLDNNLTIIEELNEILKKERIRLLLLNIVKQIINTNEIIHVLVDVSDTKKELIYLLLDDKEFSNLKVNSIGNVLLFRLVNLRQDINYEDEVDNIINLYKDNEYKLCIDRANKLFRDVNLNIDELTRSRTLFIVLAKSYYKLNKARYVIIRKYLTIAKYLNECKFEYDEKYDYTNWIEELSISIKEHKKIRREKTRTLL